MRFRFIEDHRTVWPVPVTCGMLQVSPSGCYAWRARPEGKRAAENRVLLDEIRTALTVWLADLTYIATGAAKPRVCARAGSTWPP